MCFIYTKLLSFNKWYHDEWEGGVPLGLISNGRGGGALTIVPKTINRSLCVVEWVDTVHCA